MKNVPLDQIPLAFWSELTNTWFRVQEEGAQPVELTLVKVNHSPDQRPGAGNLRGPRTENFSLVFRGPSHRLLPQKTYRFEHDQLGQFDLFIVPTGRTSDECEDQAVFNRMAKPA